MNKSEHWQAVIEQWKASGLTQKQFCAKEDIKVATLHYWIKKFRTDNSVSDEPAFLPIRSISEPDFIELRFGLAAIRLTIQQLPETLLILQRKGLLNASA
ncbi:IS66 family insertion sequence element accessory protein TnpA [Halioxenophilus aromaticivorans]|jgi:transposase-like protein|uniref:Transposase n=1 Tax=Halioxenophilus aromaticivorans TaxID=1306992 RepID=A0AAV3U7S0_9ALTE|tara:strand:- start:354 stop:653 length:300 start_codon:yes stop_codon:yes gene_type:complete